MIWFQHALVLSMSGGAPTTTTTTSTSTTTTTTTAANSSATSGAVATTAIVTRGDELLELVRGTSQFPASAHGASAARSFTLVTRLHSLHLEATDAQQLEYWLVALQTLIERLQS